ncbi:metallo-beta-lactamase domain-containing protein [Klebsormidium nitens]|uniref:Metallo-beta-lactamase domain-containing protein n=1 Tax=Klebsormidium nitens TaxID=105231 RepID=A0A1Y1HT23_KLENI|nr:metallo-beta-lactamase domain-containing protein [Klebsormidium nitens]|eukprot:GAQ80972.1 metallo-beta-lactamase domain-containing protein [Klebsormidium nitens]
MSDASGLSLSSELIVLGSGSSTGVPTPSCVLRPTNPPCSVCQKSLALPPEINKNYRCNPSLLISHCSPDGRRSYIQIDAGKHFRESLLRWYPRYNIPNIDALILTHEHADAVFGLDDIRGVQAWSTQTEAQPLPVYLSQHSLDSLTKRFDYLVQKPPAGSSVRRVAQLDWRVIESSHAHTFEAGGLTFRPLPVEHGRDYTCLGFLFGVAQRVAYLSDVSRIPPDIEKLISVEGNGPVDILILDSLLKYHEHNTHICFRESLRIIRRLRPRKAYLIGMTHEFDHEETNAELAELKEEGLDVELSYDGLRIPVEL